MTQQIPGSLEIHFEYFEIQEYHYTYFSQTNFYKIYLGQSQIFLYIG